MEETGLIFSPNEPIEEIGSFPVMLCVSTATLSVFYGFFKSGCFPKIFLTCSVFDYNFEAPFESLVLASALKFKIYYAINLRVHCFIDH